MDGKNIFLQHLFLIFFFVVHHVATECTSTDHVEIGNCSHQAFQKSPGWKIETVCRNTTKYEQPFKRKGTFDNLHHTLAKRCTNEPRCTKTYQLSVFNQQLFAITMKNTVLDMLTKCCQACAKCNVIKGIDHIMHVTSDILNQSDIIFPVVAESNLIKLHGFYFLPTFDAPSAFYCMLRKTNTKILMEVIVACAQMWPLLVICLIFAFISGFLVWIIETRMNTSEFPRRFHVGLFEGFWWSFVSMTTVGFGDKVPKSHLGRVYAVVWILLGISLCSMFTATLTSEIIHARLPANTDIRGKKVGVLKGRLHDIAVVAQHGGILHSTTIRHTMRGIHELLIMLENKEIHGFLIDRNTYYHFSHRMHTPKYHYIFDKLQTIDIMTTEKHHVTGSLSCGMMLKTREDYKYFKAYFDNHHTDLVSCNFLRMNTIETAINQYTDIFGAEGELFENVLYYSVGVLGVVVGVGALTEWRKWYLGVATSSGEFNSVPVTNYR